MARYPTNNTNVRVLLVSQLDKKTHRRLWGFIFEFPYLGNFFWGSVMGPLFGVNYRGIHWTKEDVLDFFLGKEYAVFKRDHPLTERKVRTVSIHGESTYTSMVKEYSRPILSHRVRSERRWVGYHNGVRIDFDERIHPQKFVTMFESLSFSLKKTVREEKHNLTT